MLLWRPVSAWSRRARIVKSASGDKRFCDPRLHFVGVSMIRQLRLYSGLVMLAYVTMHLVNHAAGLVSLEAMDEVLWYVSRIWGNPVGQTLLYGGFVVHYSLSLWGLWERRSLRLRFSELSQIALGFAIPIMLVRHVVGTRIADDFFHTNSAYYSRLLWTYFVHSPSHGYLQMAVLVVAWAHAMLGLHFWLRVRPWYARVQAPALAVAVLVPVLTPWRHRSRSARHRARRRSELDARGIRAHDAAAAGNAACSRRDHQSAHSFLWRHGAPGLAGADRSAGLAAPTRCRAHRLP